MTKPKAKAKKKAESLSADLERFFSSELAEHAARGLSESVCIALILEEETVYFTRKGSKNTLLKSLDGSADVHFWIPEVTMRHFLVVGNSPGTSLGTMGVSVFEHMFAVEEGRKVKFRVDASFLTLWSKGYFSVLKAGGPEVASFLTRWGFDSITKIGKLLSQMRR